MIFLVRFFFDRDGATLTQNRLNMIDFPSEIGTDRQTHRHPVTFIHRFVWKSIRLFYLFLAVRPDVTVSWIPV